MPRGYFGIGVYHPKNECNTGTLWRSALAFGADFLFTVGRRYKPQSSDTSESHRHCPLFTFTDLQDLIDHLPRGCPLIGVELTPGSHPLPRFVHPEQACYLLGAEDHGLPKPIIERCHYTIMIPNATHCLNVATAGSIVIYDRAMKKGIA